MAGWLTDLQRLARRMITLFIQFVETYSHLESTVNALRTGAVCIESSVLVYASRISSSGVLVLHAKVSSRPFIGGYVI